MNHGRSHSNQQSYAVHSLTSKLRSFLEILLKNGYFGSHTRFAQSVFRTCWSQRISMNHPHTPRPSSHRSAFESGDATLHSALVHQLYAQSKVTAQGGLLAALLMTATLWTGVEHQLLVGWLFVFLFVQGARYWMVHAFMQCSPQGSEATRWGTWFLAAAAVTHLWWGLAGVILFPASTMLLQFLLAAFITIVVASVAVAHAPLTECYVPSILLTATPIICRLFYQGDEAGVTLGLVGVAYTCALLGTGRAAHRMMSDSVRLRLEKNQLVRELQQAGQLLEVRIAERTAQLLEANEQLKREICEREQAEEKLKLLSLAVEQCQEGIAVVDVRGNLLYLNEPIARMHGHARAELVGKHLSVLHAPEQMPSVDDANRLVRETGLFTGEIWHTRKGGEAFPTLMHSSLLLDSSGSPMGIIGTMSDISELKAAEKSLEAEKRKFEALADKAPFGMVMIARDGGFQYVNRKFTHMFGYELSEIPNGKTWFRLVFPDPRERHAAIGFWMNDLTTPCAEKPEERSFTIQTKDGSRKIISFVSVELHNGEFLITCEDITGRKQAEAQIEKSLTLALRLRAEAEAANMAKSQFLAMMSHEIRTPLNSIIGFSEMMQDLIPGTLNERQLEYVGHVVENGRHLLRLLNDILDLSSIEAGKLILKLSEVHVPTVLEASVSMVKEKALKHDLNLEVRVGADLAEARIVADELRLKQILFNLVSNAAKFTPDGGKIELEARVEGENLVISLRDTGIGILPEDHQRIFHAFEQVERSYSRPYEGSGLGLALTKKLVELHLGRIWVESQGQGMGSTFSFAIPMR
jgi:PAS domain S-box-containing protein